MLWFNTPLYKQGYVFFSFQYILCCGSTLDRFRGTVVFIMISIHLMLWFNSNVYSYNRFNKRFQYILCCGSTAFRARRRVRGMEFQYILCCGSTPAIKLPKIKKQVISIHLMLWFNFFLVVRVGTRLSEFQYILCCGSTGSNIIFMAWESEFQYILCCGSTTTHFFKFKSWYYFNTSYVVVQP